jgi:glycosyltransferase involved in cell wall biosynthesis
VNNVLLISYLFPPAAGIGVPRAVSYTKYLPEHECKVFVLTASRPATPLLDYGSVREVPSAATVYRAFNPEIPYGLRDRVWKRVSKNRNATDHLYKANSEKALSVGALLKSASRAVIERVACPDAQRTWVPFATRRAFQIIERHNIDTVLLNTPPYSSMEIAVAVKRRYPRLKLITDIRDDWCGYYLLYFDTAATERKKRLAARLEREVIEASDYVSSVTPAQMEGIRGRYPGEPREKFICTPNGYDPEVFATFKPRPHGGSGMVVSYFGSVYNNPVYSPRNYLDAVDALPAHIRDRIETRFIGRVAADAAPCLENRLCRVTQSGFVPIREGLRGLEESDYLLLIANDKTTHAGKLFDYLATGKPILALTPVDGAIARILRETQTGWCVDPDDKGAIRQALIDAVEWCKEPGKLPQPNWSAIREYAWPNLVASLARKTALTERLVHANCADR